MSKVYLDNAATTKVRDEVINAITEVIKKDYGNPSSTHSYGRSSKAIIENSRKEIAGLLNVSSSEIIFTSGGTEGDNMILRNCVKNLGIKHIVSSKIEHHAVTHTLDYLSTLDNLKISYVKTHNNGDIDYTDLEKILSNSKVKTLVSLMHINNELGNISDIQLISKICKKYHALFLSLIHI